MLKDLWQTLQTHKKPLAFLAATWGIYFIALFSRILEWGPDGIYGGHVNVWSDWSIHIGMVNLFASKSPSEWFAYHPLFAEGKFTYPFLTNLISGLLVKLGVPLVSAMTIPSILYSFLLLGGLYLVAFVFLKSKRQAVLTVFLFFFSSGPGFLLFLNELFHKFSWDSLIYPPLDFTRIDEKQWYGGNVIESLLAPQRAFLLGMTLASWGIFGFFRGMAWAEMPEAKTSKKKSNGFLKSIFKKFTLGRRYWVFSGICIGLLAFTHVHSLIAITLGLTLVLIHRLIAQPKLWRDLPFLAIPSTFLAFCYYFFFLRNGIQTTHFQNWSPGWTSQGGFLAWVLLWLKIWGLAIPLAILGFVSYFFWQKGNTLSSKLFLGSFIGLFAVANLILFQPVAWDNSKLFFWCYFMFCIVIARLLSQIYHYRRVWSTALTGVLLFGMISAGMLETYRIQWISKNRYRMTDLDDILLAEQVQLGTNPRDLFLTSPDHNQFIMMWSARPILLGFPPWAWNYGFNYEEAERHLKLIYLGTNKTEELLTSHHIHYVVIGPGELRDLHANETYFAKQYRLAFSNKNYRIYDVLSPNIQNPSPSAQTEPARL